MAGVYIHIPFCRQACHYCNFHFSVSHRQIRPFLDSLLLELDIRHGFFGEGGKEKVFLDSIYFGGGTPSILETGDLNRIFERLYQYFSFDRQTEITLEANPDDLSPEKINELKATPLNRLSIGIQSFHAPDLAYMNRIHSPVQAIQAVENAKAAGFENLTLDLIYGTPTMDDKTWMENLQRVIDFGVQHVSAYALTVEKKTPLEVRIRRGQMPAVDEEQTARQFEMMTRKMDEAGFDHYEISNFARPGFYSRHNLSYWTGLPYLGLGPSAHSYRNGQRWWNAANTGLYIDSVNKGSPAGETEMLTPAQQYDEYVMTSLRTMWGCSLDEVEYRWGKKYLDHLLENAGIHIQGGWLTLKKGKLLLSGKGKLFADRIASDLFLAE
jgi:putative oxygen-independent coproporphyrinogen III oxidase